MKNFCYWQEDVPDYIQLQYLKELEKICLLRQMEYRLFKEEREAGLVNNKDLTIFCPYKNAEQANECMDYKVMEYGKISK